MRSRPAVRKAVSARLLSFCRCRQRMARGSGSRWSRDLLRLSAKSHSAVLLWDLTRSEALAAVRAEVFATPRCLGSLVKPFVLLAYLNEHCSDLTSHPHVPPCPRGDKRCRSSNVPRRQPRVATLCRSRYSAMSGGVLVQAWPRKIGHEPGIGCFLQSIFLPTRKTDISRCIP